MTTDTFSPRSTTDHADRGHVAGREVTPSAVGDDLRRLWNLTFTLALTDFRLRYLNSVLGYLWSLLRPLLFFGVMYVVFTRVLRVGAGPHYGVYLLVNIILWTFFQEVTNVSVTCLLAREGLLRKMRFPRMAIPLSVCLTASFTLMLNLTVVLLFAVVSGVTPRLTWLEMPVIVALWAVLALGVGMILSVLFVRMRDILPLWEVFSQVLFYGSPLIYTLSRYPHALQKFLLINPIAMLTTQTSHAFVDPSYKTPSAIMGGPLWLLAPLVVLGLIFIFGTVLFVRRAPLIAENL